MLGHARPFVLLLHFSPNSPRSFRRRILRAALYRPTQKADHEASGLSTQKQDEAGRSIFMPSIQGLAKTGSVAATFFATPLFYSENVVRIRSFSFRHCRAGYEVYR